MEYRRRRRIGGFSFFWCLWNERMKENSEIHLFSFRLLCGILVLGASSSSSFLSFSGLYIGSFRNRGIVNRMKDCGWWKVEVAGDMYIYKRKNNHTLMMMMIVREEENGIKKMVVRVFILYEYLEKTESEWKKRTEMKINWLQWSGFQESELLLEECIADLCSSSCYSHICIYIHDVCWWWLCWGGAKDEDDWL